jgi:hypothetical protein
MGYRKTGVLQPAAIDSCAPLTAMGHGKCLRGIAW